MTKTVDFQGVILMLKQLEELISMTTCVPALTDQAFSGNTTGEALEFKLFALKQYSVIVDRIFMKGYKRLFDLITARLNFSNNTSWDFRTIVINMNHNTPTREEGRLRASISAYKSGMISNETAIRESGLEIDASEELVRLKREKGEEYEYYKEQGA